MNSVSEPLTFIGKMAGICWNADIWSDNDKNRKRAIECIRADHGRVLEFVDVTVVLEGYSARCMRELYTHIGGSPTRLQSSTRYVEARDMEAYVPASCKGNGDYDRALGAIRQAYGDLLDSGVPREDAANILPLGMMSKMVWKVNLRTLINFFHKRLCTRALKEIRNLATELKDILSSQDVEWKWLADNLFVPQCEQYTFMNKELAFCQEARCCGRHMKISELHVSKENAGHGAG